MEKVNELLKSYRRRTGLSQLAVAEKFGVHPQFVSNWERGRSLPPGNYMTTLIKLYKLTKTERFNLYELMWVKVTQHAANDFADKYKELK